MNVLLVKPCPETLKFGLAPFFQTEPLGLEYIAAALKKSGHSASIIDMRFHKHPLPAVLKEYRPDVVGIACLHILDAQETLRLAEAVKDFNAGIYVVVGGHAASAYPEALNQSEKIDALCIGEGEAVLPALCDALAHRRDPAEIPSLAVRSGRNGFAKPDGDTPLLELERIDPPDRSPVSVYRKHYCCLNYMPIWTLETSRGCTYRCKFCSVWQLYKGSYRFHPPESVRFDFENTGRNVFVIDDFFWGDKERSADLAKELARSKERKNWMLVQSRADTVAENMELLKLWRPLARNFDIFFGFEAATKSGLDSLNKNSGVAEILEAIAVARRLDYGVTGSFIIDPDFVEEDFIELWRFMDAHQLYRAGFTILTPLPGTHYFNQIKGSIRDFNWNHYDLHHLLWPSKLPVDRFFDFYCETWRRSVLNLAGKKKWWRWLTQVNFMKIPRLLRILRQTQKLMDPKVYLAATVDFADPASIGNRQQRNGFGIEAARSSSLAAEKRLR
jgi:radical SAM superfamily enzyme YgiQ (UPF0313 family)